MLLKLLQGGLHIAQIGKSLLCQELLFQAFCSGFLYIML